MPLAGKISQSEWGFALNFVIVGLLPLAGLAVLLSCWGRDDAKTE